jgi:hypothetical protein
MTQREVDRAASYRVDIIFDLLCALAMVLIWIVWAIAEGRLG